MYKIPNKYYFRLHHVRPRFKDDVENVLLYVANSCALISKPVSNKVYEQALFKAIKLFPGNVDKADKTIHNWRTEISALFGLYIENKNLKITQTGNLANILSETSDLVQFFKYFLFKFQYPGGHLKSDYIAELIQNGVKFKPARYILLLLHEADEYIGKPLGISKSETANCIFNDLRVSRDNRNVKNVIDLILQNRTKKEIYLSDGDYIRYAGDILDYMVLANLLVERHGYFYINKHEENAVLTFINDETYFHGYDDFYKKTFDLKDLNVVEHQWFEYVNSGLSESLFKTDLIAFISSEKENETDDIDDDTKLVDQKIREILNADVNTKAIGDLGESLVIGHEKMRITNLGREDLIHLIQKIPTSFAVGYDIQSIEGSSSTKRYIEVKTTISKKKINWLGFHLTPNEWDAAETLRKNYFVYRLMLNSIDKTLYIIQNPVGLYKEDRINMSPRNNGAEISFDNQMFNPEKLLIWKKSK